MHDLSVFADVVRRLEQAGFPYFLTGSVAMSCYVPRRTTIAIDIVVRLGQPDIPRVVRLFETDYYVADTAIEEAIRLHRSFNIIHYEQLMKVDLIVPAASALQDERFARRRRLVVDDVEVWVIAPEDLILAKLDWARTSRSDRQLEDVRSLLAGVADLDRGYLETSAGRLGVADLLEEVQRS